MRRGCETSARSRRGRSPDLRSPHCRPLRRGGRATHPRYSPAIVRRAALRGRRCGMARCGVAAKACRDAARPRRGRSPDQRSPHCRPLRRGGRATHLRYSPAIVRRAALRGRRCGMDRRVGLRQGRVELPRGRVGHVAPTNGHHIAVRSAGVGVSRNFDIRPPSFVGRPYAAAVAGWTGVGLRPGRVEMRQGRVGDVAPTYGHRIARENADDGDEEFAYFRWPACGRGGTLSRCRITFDVSYRGTRCS
jgi:hypothetical protein